MNVNQDNDSSAPFWADAAADPRSDGQLFEAAFRELDLDARDPESTKPFRTLLVRSSPEIFAHAQELLASDVPELRRVGIVTISGMNDPASRTESEWGQRIYTETSLPLLDALARRELDADVRITIAVALEEIERPEGVATLLELSRDVEPDVRARVAFSLATLSFVDDARWTEAIIARLRQLAEDAEARVRDAAVFGLATLDLDRSDVRETFAHALHDPDPEVASDAAAGLIRLADPRGEEAMLDLIRQGRLDDGYFVVEAALMCAGPRLDEALDAANQAGLQSPAGAALRDAVEDE